MRRTSGQQNARAVDTRSSDDHFWEFKDVEELRRALYEYTALLDGTLIRHYGPKTGGGEEGPTPEEAEEYECRTLRKRSTIDIAMEQMEPEYPTWHRVIDLYYRQGLSTEPQGWLLLMARLGLRRTKCPPLVRCALDRGEEFEDNRLDVPRCKEYTRKRCGKDYHDFRVQLTLAIGTLWYAIEGRSEWKP